MIIPPFLCVLFSSFVFAQERPPDCHKNPGSLPDSDRKIGEVLSHSPIKHIFVLMQENHSFDNYFGKLDQAGYQGQVDGLDAARESLSYHEESYCFQNIAHDWFTLHHSWDHGRNDKFGVDNNTLRPYGYYDESDLNYYYALANRFAIGDRYFSSVMGPTFPNRMFFMAATAGGKVDNSLHFKSWFKNRKTVFDLLSENQVSWRYYFGNVPAAALLPVSLLKNISHLALIKSLKKHLREDHLPSVIFIDQALFLDEEPPKDPQLGQRAVAAHLRDLIGSQYWKDSVFFLTYDEGGGFYDHVSPPLACAPDSVTPQRSLEETPDHYTRYGFRVPFVAISPYVKSHYVSHLTYDHTSILKFIETQFNLPALSKRDANANDLQDIFDFTHPNYSVSLPEPSFNQEKYELFCKKKSAKEQLTYSQEESD